MDSWSARTDEADPELRHLRKAQAAATSSWQEAELTRQMAQREAAAVEEALQKVEHQPEVSSKEEERLLQQLESIRAERRRAEERAGQVEKLRADAVRSARTAAAAEVEAQMRRLNLEKVEAQQQATKARVEAQQRAEDARMRVEVQHRAEEAALQAAAVPSPIVRGSRSEGEAAPSGAAIASASAPAEVDTLMSILEVHQQLQACQTRLRSQTRLTASLQDKLRTTEASLRESQAAEQRARADYTRQMTKRKEEAEGHTRSERKLEKRLEAAEQKAMQLVATNESLREEVSSLRQAVVAAERRAVEAEDGLGRCSKSELRKLTDDLNEERRKRREQERVCKVQMDAEAKAHAATRRELQAKHDARKQSLKAAQHRRDHALDRLEFEKKRADTAEHEVVLSHWKMMQVENENHALVSAPRHCADGGSNQSRTTHADAVIVPFQPALSPSVGSRAAASTSDWQEMAEEVRRSPSPRPASPPAISPPTPRAQEDLNRATKRSLELQRGAVGRLPYSFGVDTNALNIPGNDDNAHLFDRASARGRRSVPHTATSLKDKLSGSLAKLGDLFNTWDCDKSGNIDKVEFRLGVKGLGLTVPDQVCDSVFREFDPSGSGSVDYREFVLRMLRDALQRSSWRVVAMFRQWDSDGDGTVSREEFCRGIQAAGFDASPTDIDAIFDDIDLDGSGRIEYEQMHARLRQGVTFKAASLRPASPRPEDRSNSLEGTASHTSPRVKPIDMPPARWTSVDPFNGSSPSSRDIRQGRAVSAHLQRLAANRS